MTKISFICICYYQFFVWGSYYSLFLAEKKVWKVWKVWKKVWKADITLLVDRGRGWGVGGPLKLTGQIMIGVLQVIPKQSRSLLLMIVIDVLIPNSRPRMLIPKSW